MAGGGEPQSGAWTKAMSTLKQTNGIHCCHFRLHAHTVQYKILEGENFGEFGKLQEIRQNFLVQNLPFYKSWYIAS